MGGETRHVLRVQGTSSVAVKGNSRPAPAACLRSRVAADNGSAPSHGNGRTFNFLPGNAERRVAIPVSACPRGKRFSARDQTAMAMPAEPEPGGARGREQGIARKKLLQDCRRSEDAEGQDANRPVHDRGLPSRCAVPFDSGLSPRIARDSQARNIPRKRTSPRCIRAAARAAGSPGVRAPASPGSLRRSPSSAARRPASA